MFKVSKIAAALAVVPVLAFAAPVLADSPGQLSNGADNYKVRNVTQNGAYAQSISAACNETVKYSVTLSNSDFGMLTDLTVKADLASGNISASAKNVSGNTTSVSGKATVSVPSNGSLSYVNGSTVRINETNTSTTNLADGVTAGGVNVGSLNGSTLVFVQFQAKVDCKTPPVTPPTPIQVCELATKKVVTIDEKDFNSSKYSKDLNDCKTPVTPGQIQVCDLNTNQVVTIDESAFDDELYSKDLNDCQTTPPSELPHTGASQTIALFGAAVVVAAGAHRLFSRRQTR